MLGLWSAFGLRTVLLCFYDHGSRRDDDDGAAKLAARGADHSPRGDDDDGAAGKKSSAPLRRQAALLVALSPLGASALSFSERQRALSLEDGARSLSGMRLSLFLGCKTYSP